MEIKTKDKIYDVLCRAGYNFHFTEKDGFIKQIDRKMRFHLVLYDDYSGDLHIDKTINNMHKLCYIPSMLKIESYRIKDKDIKKEIKAIGLKKLQSRRVIKRSWFNPFRYLYGKFKVIKL